MGELASAASKPVPSSALVGGARYPHLMLVVLGLSALVFAAVLYLTSYKNFFYDEWDFITSARPWNLNLLLLPHNEHWVTIPILVWKLLFVTVGLKSHIPYQAALLVTHVAAVLLLFVLIRRRSGDLPAFGAAVILLVLGSGWLNIVWAFQISFVGSVAFGVLAMLILEGEARLLRILSVSAALLCSLMCSGVGLAFLCAVAVQVLADRRWRYLWAFALPVVAFGVWFLTYGAELPGTPGAPCPTCLPKGFGANAHHGQITVAYIESLAGFVFTGLQATAAGVLGIVGVGAVLLPAFAVLVALHWFRQRGIEAWQLGQVAGILAWFTLVGLGRAQLGVGAAADSHYVYVGAVFLLPLIVDGARELPWRKLWKPVITGLFAVAVFGNALQLRGAALNQVELMRDENIELQTVAAFRGAPDMALNRTVDATIMPQLKAGSYLAATSELGSPLPPASVDSLRRLPPHLVNQEMVILFGDALKVTSDSGRSVAGIHCDTTDSQTGTTIDLEVPGGQWIRLQSAEKGDALLFLSFVGPPDSGPLRHLQLQPSVPSWVYLPNTGRAVVWRLRVQTPAVGVLQICGATGFQGPPVAYVYRAEAEDGSLDPAWSVVQDADASSGRAVRIHAGTQVTSFKNDSFGPWVVPVPGLYDVWYRVKVASTAGAEAEMTLGLWDGTANTWVTFGRFAPTQVGTHYSWVRAAAAITPIPDHAVQYLATFNAQTGPATLTTDWYVDQAVMVPTGSSPPA